MKNLSEQFLGRIGRGDFALRYILTVVVVFFAAGGLSNFDISPLGVVVLIVAGLYSLLLIIQRLNDLEWSWWYLLLILIPLVNIGFSVVLYFRKGAAVPTLDQTYKKKEDISFPEVSVLVSPMILEKEKAEPAGERVDSSKELYFIAMALGVFFTVLLIVVLSANKSSDITPQVSTVPAPQQTQPDFSGYISKDTSPEPNKQETITNPEYLKNPAGYLLDYNNTIKSQTPTDKPLWVEEVVDSAVLAVSYPVVKAGENIIVVEHLGIPGLSQHQFYAPIFKTTECTEVSLECMKKASECTEKASIDFMKKYLLHKEVYLDPEEVVFGTIKGWRLQMVDTDGKNKIDVAQFIGLNGYGFHYIPSPGGFTYTPHTTPESIEKEKKKLDSLPYSSYQEKTLQDEIAVARLAKRGFWGTCQ